MFGPRATSTRIRFVVSSTRVELICSFRTALMTVAASRKRFSILSAAEYTSSDRISPLFRFSATSFSRGVGVSTNGSLDGGPGTPTTAPLAGSSQSRTPPRPQPLHRGAMHSMMGAPPSILLASARSMSRNGSRWNSFIAGSPSPPFFLCVLGRIHI